MNQRKTPRPPAYSFYLGKEDIAKTRAKRLDEVAAQLNLDNRSELLQAIADGRVAVVRQDADDTRTRASA